MSERSRTSDTQHPRTDRGREWELFVREGEADPLTHAGSVSAPTASIAREQAQQLFGGSATDMWLCPADETERLTATPLGER